MSGAMTQEELEVAIAALDAFQQGARYGARLAFVGAPERAVNLRKAKIADRLMKGLEADLECLLDSHPG